MSVGIIQSPNPLVVATDVDQSLLATLEMWLPTYLTLLSHRRALGYSLAVPVAYANTIESDEFLDHQLPAVIVTTARARATKGGPQRGYEARWDVTISGVIRGRTGPESRLNAALLEGSVRQVIVQKAVPAAQDSDTAIQGVKWLTSEITPVPDTTGAGRYLAAGTSTYNVWTDAAVLSNGGPDVPDATQYAENITVTEVNTSVEAE